MIVIADLDNTLCESCKRIDEEMRMLIECLIDEGITFVVISGSDVNHIREQVPIHRVHMLGCSGTKYFYNGKMLYEETLNDKEFAAIHFALDDLMKHFKIYKCDEQIQDRGTQVTFSILGRNADSEIKRTYDPLKLIRKQYVKFLKPKLECFELTIGGSTSIDITREGINKGYGVKKWLEFTGFKADDCVFIGDALFPGGNDYAVKEVLSNTIETSSVTQTKVMLRHILEERI